MFQQLARPAAFASDLTAELSRRARSLDAGDLDPLRDALELAVATAVAATRAKSLLTRPLRDRGIPVDGDDWHNTVLRLYGLWLAMRPAAVQERMTALAERDKDKWRQTFPDDNDIDEERLLTLYRANEPLQANGVHGLGDVSLALRWWVAQTLATVAGPGGSAFDWGGSDGVCCTFMRAAGVGEVTLFELNQAARDFGRWLNDKLGLTNMHYTGELPTRRFSVGVSTEVLEHVVDPPRTLAQMRGLLEPGGVMFITSSFGVPQDTHLKCNLKYAGREGELISAAGFEPWTPPTRAPVPMLPQWGFWRRVG